VVFWVCIWKPLMFSFVLFVLFDTTLSTSSMTMRSLSCLATPITPSECPVRRVSGLGSMFCFWRVRTSTTLSTITPMGCLSWTIIMMLGVWFSFLSVSPMRLRRSITGMTSPRRLVTPLTYCGAYGTGVAPSKFLTSRTWVTSTPYVTLSSENVSILISSRASGLSVVAIGDYLRAFQVQRIRKGLFVYYEVAVHIQDSRSV
jgi:hypothetical protein